MKILFIYPSIGGFFQPSFHAGIASISAVLKQSNHETQLFVLSSWNQISDLSRRIEDYKPKVVAFTATASTFPAVVKAANLIKKNFRKLFIICGGVHTTIFPESFIDIDAIDGICVGEGEFAMLDLINRLQNKSNYLNIDGFWFRDSHNNIIKNKNRPLISSLDVLPMPDREIFAQEGTLYYLDQPFNHPDEKGLEFIFSRGCPFDCTYCSNHALKKFYGPGYVRFKSPDLAIAEIKKVVKIYHPSYLQFHDDIFTLNKLWLSKFLQKYREVNIKIPFNCNLRPDISTPDILRLLKKSYCRGVQFGLESGDLIIRKKILNRNMTNQQIIKSFSKAHKIGLETFAFLMMGFPNETKEKFLHTAQLVSKIKPNNYHIQIFYPYPGTKLHKVCIDNKLINNKPQENFIERQDTILDLPKFKRKDILYFYKHFSSIVDLYRTKNSLFKDVHRKFRLYLASKPPSFILFYLYQLIFIVDMAFFNKVYQIRNIFRKK